MREFEGLKIEDVFVVCIVKKQCVNVMLHANMLNVKLIS